MARLFLLVLLIFQFSADVDQLIDDFCICDAVARARAAVRLKAAAESSEPSRTEVIAALVRLIENENFRSGGSGARQAIWCDAAMLLGELKAEEALPALEQGLDEPEPMLRCGAARALVMIGGPQASAALAQASAREQDPDVLFCFEKK